MSSAGRKKTPAGRVPIGSGRHARPEPSLSSGLARHVTEPDQATAYLRAGPEDRPRADGSVLSMRPRAGSSGRGRIRHGGRGVEAGDFGEIVTDASYRGLPSAGVACVL